VDPAICYIGIFELWTDILKRAKNPTDKNSIIEAVKATKVTSDGRCGRLDGQPRTEVQHPQLLREAARWRPVGQRHSGKHNYAQEIVASEQDATNIPITAQMKEMTYPA